MFAPLTNTLRTTLTISLSTYIESLKRSTWYLFTDIQLLFTAVYNEPPLSQKTLVNPSLPPTTRLIIISLLSQSPPLPSRERFPSPKFPYYSQRITPDSEATDTLHCGAPLQVYTCKQNMQARSVPMYYTPWTVSLPCVYVGYKTRSLVNISLWKSNSLYTDAESTAIVLVCPKKQFLILSVYIVINNWGKGGTRGEKGI